MAEYIDKAKVLEKAVAIKGCFSKMISAWDVAHIPSADVAEVKHGKWEEIRNPYGELEGWIHVECGREVKIKETYCPKCGTKMDGEE